MLDKDKTILVFGANGIIGKKLVEKLQKDGYTKIITPSSRVVDLKYYGNTETYLRAALAFGGIIINLVAVKTNIKINKDSPFDVYSNTLTINNNLFRAIAYQKSKPEKVLSVVCSCGYAGKAVLVEGEFDNGPVHPSVEPHGYAKRAVYYMSKFCRRQYGINSVCVALNNVYGNTDWSRPDCLKVLESLVKKIVDAKVQQLPSVTLWGTGAARREFIHVDDCVTGILRTLELYNDEELLNIGCGYDISIRQLAEGIKLAVGYNGAMLYDINMPDGQLSKLLSTEKMNSVLQWSPEVSLCEGIHQTIYSYYNYLGEDVGR